MGDNGKLYVPEAVGLALILMLTLNLIPNPNSLCVFEALVEVYKTEMVAVASTMTPNQFEA